MKYLFTLFICIHAMLPIKAQEKPLPEKNGSPKQVDEYCRQAYELRTIQPDTALIIANKAHQIAIQQGYNFGEIHALLLIAYINAVKGYYRVSLQDANQVIDMATKLKNDSLAGYGNLVAGLSLYNTSRYDEAIEQDITAIRHFEKLSLTDGIIKAKINLANIYQQQNKLDKAEKTGKEALDMLKNVPDKLIHLNLLHLMANVYGMQNKLSQALEMDEQGIIATADPQYKYFSSQFYDNKANCFMYSGAYDQALSNFMTCIQIDSSYGNKKQLSDTYLNLGNLMLLQKKYAAAIPYLLHAIQLSEEADYKQGKFQSLELLSQVYQQMGNPEKALQTIQSAYVVKDSILNSHTENKIAELETIYNTEKKERQLQQQEISLAKKNYFIAAIIAFFLFSGVLAGVFYRKRKIQHALNLQLAIQQQQEISTRAIIQAEENERRRIAADLHDGVGQMMSAVKMNLSAFEQDIPFNNEQQKKTFTKALDLVDESCKEIRSISHQMMPNALLNSGLGIALKEFIDKIDNRVLSIQLHTEGLEQRLESNLESVLYRVIQECVNNVIKHAKATSLDISLIKDKDGISATIEDNGIGFDSRNHRHFEGIGLKNIISRVEFLQGTIEFDSQPGKGTLVAIHVPNK